MAVQVSSNEEQLIDIGITNCKKKNTSIRTSINSSENSPLKCNFYVTRSCISKENFHASEAPTSGIQYHVVIRPGKLIRYEDRITNKTPVFVEERGWVKPHWEVICLIWDAFTFREMMILRLEDIISMHEPIKVSEGDLWFLFLSLGTTDIELNSYPEGLDKSWPENVGFMSLEPNPSESDRSLDVLRT